MTIDMTIDQQVALDEALVPHASRLRIGKSNFRLRSDITSKESTLQVVYDVLRLTPLYKAFLVTTDVPEIYMQEFWATVTVHHHSIRFNMNNKKRIVNLEYFREMLHICLRILNQTFDELPFEEEILAFIRYLGHSERLRRSLMSTSTSYINHEDHLLQLSTSALVGKVQVEYKDAKKKNEMYYPRFTKVIINFFMAKDPLIPKRNMVNWHYVRDDQMFTTIKLVSRNQNTQQFGAMLLVELINEDIRNFAAYKEYYAIASGAAPLKTKASVRKTQSSSDTTMPPPTTADTRLSTSAKGKQPAKSSKAKGLYVLSEVALTKDEQIKLATKKSPQQTHISQASGSSVDEGSDDDDVDEQSEADDDDYQEDEDEQDDNVDDQDSNNDGDEFVHPKLSTHDENTKDKESFDHIVQTPSQVANSDDDESHGMNVGGEERPNAKDDDEELYRDVNINLEGRDVQMTDSLFVSSQFVTSMFNPSPDAGIDSLFETTHRVDVPLSTIVVPLLVTALSLPLPSIPIMSQISYAVAADLSELELKKILIEKMESNKSIHRSDEQRNLYKALVDAYECDKIILDTYGDTVTLKRRRDDADKDKEPSARSDRGSKRKREGKKLESTSAPKEKAFKTNGIMQESGGARILFGRSLQGDNRSIRLEQPEGHQYPHNLLKPQPLIPNSRGRRVIPFDHFINNDLEYLRGGASIQKYTTSVTKTKATYYGHIKWIEDLIVEWHDYKHLDWITVRRDNDKLYKFKEGDFKRLHIQDIEDMLLLLVHGKLTNLTVKERFAFNRLNLTKPDTYRNDLKHKEAYTAYYNPRGFIHQNKDKQNRLMRIDELHKFSDGMLNDVRTALDDRIKGIQMKYLPQTIWRRSNKERTTAMIQAIDKQLKTRRIMRSLEKFIGGRLYEGNFRMLQRSI
nr:hypothetical protein [Tanacetum cinerariifolium]